MATSGMPEFERGVAVRSLFNQCHAEGKERDDRIKDPIEETDCVYSDAATASAVNDFIGAGYDRVSRWI